MPFPKQDCNFGLVELLVWFPYHWGHYLTDNVPLKGAPFSGGRKVTGSPPALPWWRDHTGWGVGNGECRARMLSLSLSEVPKFHDWIHLSLFHVIGQFPEHWRCYWQFCPALLLLLRGKMCFPPHFIMVELCDICHPVYPSWEKEVLPRVGSCSVWTPVDITDPDKLRRKIFSLLEFYFEIPEFIFGSYCGSQMIAQVFTSFNFFE